MDLHKSFRLVKSEMIITQILFAVPVLNLFWRDYAGMDQVEIALSQMMFMVVLIIMDIPTGWVADRFSRKRANMLGDLISGLGMVMYAFAGNLFEVVIAEVIFSIGSAFSSGADLPQLKAHCEALKKDFNKEYARVQAWTPIAVACGMLVGGLAGEHSVRITLFMSAVPMFLGAIFSKLIHEFQGETAMSRKIKRTSLRGSLDEILLEIRRAISDMKFVVHYCLKGHKQLAATIWARTILNESTHGLVWIMTPMMIAVGLPVWAVGMGWALCNLAASLGALMSGRWSGGMSTRRVFLLGVAGFVLSSAILGLSPSVFTIWLLIIHGLVRGWSGASLPTRVQELAPVQFQSTVNSVASTLNRIMYIPLVLVMGVVGKHNPENALLLSAVLFGVLGVLVLPMLSRHTQSI